MAMNNINLLFLNPPGQTHGSKKIELSPRHKINRLKPPLLGSLDNGGTFFISIDKVNQGRSKFAGIHSTHKRQNPTFSTIQPGTADQV
jgi:hypothetical protein